MALQGLLHKASIALFDGAHVQVEGGGHISQALQQEGLPVVHPILLACRYARFCSATAQLNVILLPQRGYRLMPHIVQAVTAASNMKPIPCIHAQLVTALLLHLQSIAVFQCDVTAFKTKQHPQCNFQGDAQLQCTESWKQKFRCCICKQLFQQPDCGISATAEIAGHINYWCYKEPKQPVHAKISSAGACAMFQDRQ